jgi:hypothetical protein
VSQRVDWSKRADYIRSRHAVEPGWADEAAADEHAIWLTPNPPGEAITFQAGDIGAVSGRRGRCGGQGATR